MPCNRIAGPHKLYYSGYDGTDPTPVTTYLGMTGDEGVIVDREVLQQEITSDELGPNAIVDGVYQGANMTMKFIMQEVNTAIAQIFLHPWQCLYTADKVVTNDANVRQEDYGVPGRLACGVVGTLEVIPVDYSPAAGFNAGANATGLVGVYPGTVSSGNAGRRYKGMVIGTMTENLDANARFVPVVFRCYPYTSVGSPTRLVFWEWIDDFTSS